MERFGDVVLDHWRSEEGGRDDIGAFSMWFMNSEWDDLIASDSASERLGWDIYGTLKQLYDFPDRVPLDWVRSQVDRAIGEYGRAPRFGTVTVIVAPASVNAMRSVRRSSGSKVSTRPGIVPYVLDVAHATEAVDLPLLRDVPTGGIGRFGGIGIRNVNDEWIPANLTVAINH